MFKNNIFVSADGYMIRHALVYHQAYENVCMYNKNLHAGFGLTVFLFLKFQYY
jgi:hypothetical protein